MLLESQRLYKIMDEIVAYSGGKSSKTGTILSLATLLETCASDPDREIQKKLGAMRDYISALGTTIQSLSESKLDIDYLVIKEKEASWPKDNETIFGKLWHEVSSLAASFTTDYDSVGNVYEDGEEVLEVWIVAGRDQSNALKSIIDDDFVPNTGIKVNLKLVSANAVLGAVVAGTGPDLLLSTTQTEPVNYAMRNAIEDLTQFEDFDEVIGRFAESAWTPYIYGDGVYALPDTQSFSVLFYRTDILDELGLTVPQTWNELVDMIPTLQHNNMEIGLPDAISSDLSGFYSMMYQNGVELYSEDGYANLDEEGAISAFEFYLKFYTNHGQPTNYNFADRFRSGEMPVGIANFSLYNTLAVFAPELKGMWSFGLIPGTLREDGTVDHTSDIFF
jgi:ABC-type glycerol-3-phosphate transport system substrate-binding protein